MEVEVEVSGGGGRGEMDKERSERGWFDTNAPPPLPRCQQGLSPMRTLNEKLVARRSGPYITKLQRN